MESPGSLDVIGLRRTAKGMGEASAGPAYLHQQVVGTSERDQPALHRLLSMLDTCRSPKTLRRDRADRGERILDAMVQLAKDQLLQLVGSLTEAGRYYLRTAPPMTLAEAVRSSLDEAIKAKNERKFDQAFDEMNAGCNRCHGAAGRAYIVIRRPSYPSAFSNQQYSPRPSERQN